MIKTEKQNFLFLKHTFPLLQCMIKGNYLEQLKEAAGCNLYYINYKRKASISAFCIVGKCCWTISTNNN